MKTFSAGILAMIALALPPKSLPAADEKVIELWPEGVPGLRTNLPPERVDNGRVYSVNQPTLTVFPAPADKANGTAVVICPGGGYDHLSGENEALAQFDRRRRPCISLSFDRIRPSRAAAGCIACRAPRARAG